MTLPEKKKRPHLDLKHTEHRVNKQNSNKRKADNMQTVG